jgi:hypothetical protein
MKEAEAPVELIMHEDRLMVIAIQSIADLSLSKLLTAIGNPPKVNPSDMERAAKLITPHSLIWMSRMISRMLFSIAFGTPLGLVLIGLVWALVGGEKIGTLVGVVSRALGAQFLASSAYSGSPAM